MLDELGQPIYEWAVVLKLVNPLLETVTIDGVEAERSDHSLLLENKDFILVTKGDPERTDAYGNLTDYIPVYRQKYIPMGNIQNVNIYDDEEE
jgi:hypothetical protein